ncbi:DEPDC5 family protein [Megaselia abdita]
MKLYIHQTSFSPEDLVLNPKGHPTVKLNDIVEIFHPEDENCRVLLQVTDFNEDLKIRDSVSIGAQIANAFNLKNYSDVIFRLVNPSDVALDSIEITFKEQYMGRSEMFRLKQCLTNTCVYKNKKIEYTEMPIRCQVYEMWSGGERVNCGVITNDTKIVFRSSTSMVYLFLQMSSEMWDYDIHGDLYFEKAVNGFLTDLFGKWKKIGSNHEVTIVLFSRTFYLAKTLDEFPDHMKDCLQMDYKGRFYEDFYRIAIQNEKNDEWCTVLTQLRKLFTTYQDTILRCHDRQHFKIPKAYNSTAGQGNFLEVLNISLNTFEKHFLDRSFDRTGQLSVVVTPGFGVFEVDRELTNITKQRIIDNGVGSDLVCVGEQPLHAVPLLKFHNKESLTTVDDYSLPHWINLSFYSTNKKVSYSTFMPRIKIPSLKAENKENVPKTKYENSFLSCNQSENIHNSLFDYDEYDSQIFQAQPAQSTCSLQRIVRAKKTSVPSLETYVQNSQNDLDIISHKTAVLQPRRKMSDPDIHHGVSGVLSTLNGTSNLSESLIAENNVQSRKSIVSATPIIRPGRSLINPFDPSHVTIKLTSNRRRWTHIFPKGPTGVLIQQHHYQAVPAKSNSCSPAINNDTYTSFEYSHTADCSSSVKSLSLISSEDYTTDVYKKRPSHVLSSATASTFGNTPSKSLTYLWGATGEQEWTPALTTEMDDAGNGRIIIGVDWKSLTIPACLPITTDYFPDKRSLHNDYVISDYTLLPDDVNADYAASRAVYRKPLTTEEVFKEIVSQRLAQGFQLIVFEDKISETKSTTQTQPVTYQLSGSPPIKGLLSSSFQKSQSLLKFKAKSEPSKEYLLSIGRIFHKITLSGSVITVTSYRPRHPYPPINVDYRYRFYAPQHDTYEISGANFTTEKLENFNWNYMDHYICTRGDIDYPLSDNLKYWRYRMYLLPNQHPAIKKILDGQSERCDIYTEGQIDSPMKYIDNFLRFVETHLNKIKLENRHGHATPQSIFSTRNFNNNVISINRQSSKLLDGKERISPAAEAAGLSLNPEININNNVIHDAKMVTKFKPNASVQEIFDGMKDAVNGIGFFIPTQSMPSCTFVSYDAIMWLKKRLDVSRSPLEVLEAMRKEKLICHASGDWEKPIIPGFYLYYIVTQDKKSKDYSPPLGDLRAFENEWMEVEIQYGNYFEMNSPKPNLIPNFLKETPLRDNYWYSVNRQMYRSTHLEIDVTKKSDRMEWGHAKYHSVMVPNTAFEIVVDWVTASGPAVSDLINGWSRKATQCNFQLQPVPADPLAEPFTEKSDPLRGPIFIPLDTNCLIKDNQCLFHEFHEETRSERVLLLQEAILGRFGFMQCAVSNHQKDCPREYQYVHCSGNMFVLIRCAQSSFPVTDSPVRHEVNVSRMVYGHTYNTNVPKKVGFLWSWNHMIPNKKWKSFVIGGTQELFQLKMLKDFREFCSNQENRLKEFWDNSYKSIL